MKVIGLTDNFQGSAPSGTANGFPGIFLMADSTLLKDGKPFFVPDFSADMVARPTFAIHMNRLGKNIAAKFANRYYAEVTVGLSIVARDIEQRLSAANLPTALATSFDNAAVLGNFTAIDQLTPGALNAEVCIDGNPMVSFSSEQMSIDFNHIVEHISRYYTIKIGDIIFCGNTGHELPISIGHHFTASINGNTLLDFKTK